MTAAHGAWGSVVIDDQGRVVLNAEYAAVAKTQRFDVLAWTCASSDAAELVQDLTGEYGVYDWTGLEDQAPVWNQHIVQPNRLREHSSKAKADQVRYKSEVWERLALPRITTSTRVVDFGVGHGNYARHLRGEGYKVQDYEPYRTKGKYALDIRTIVGQIRGIERELRERGLYEVVVLDSVINATTSLDYQHWVLLTVNALCAADGQAGIGTRNLDRELAYENSGHSISRDSTRLNFLDNENVDMRFVKGKWQRIRYHTAESLRGLLLRCFEGESITGSRRNRGAGHLPHHVAGRRPRGRPHTALPESVRRVRPPRRHPPSAHPDSLAASVQPARRLASVRSADPLGLGAERAPGIRARRAKIGRETPPSPA
ncbi:hypothetical protein ACIO3O_02405 [Streptomyces sp. NPDC087440]|uniref:hypothetical protein n=1 Tax=Streptomyces sp. NPDC087440 TaxID=3365790 RepID=UPI003821444B